MAEPVLGLARAPGAQPQAVSTHSIQTEWVALTVSPETADNGGSTVVDPNAIDRWQTVLGGTSFVFMLKYDDGLTGITNPVVQCFGRAHAPTSSASASDAGGDPVAHKLFDQNGTHEIEIATDTTNDIDDGTFKYSDPFEVDMDAAGEVLLSIKTALAGTGTVNNSEILVKTK